MCRYVYSDQIIGSVFIHLLEQSRNEIAFSCLVKMVDDIDKTVYKQNNAILNITTRDIYSTIREYNDFFELSNDTLKLTNSLSLDYEHTEKNLSIIKRLKQYFTVGIPNDIMSSMDKVVLSSLKGC